MSFSFLTKIFSTKHERDVKNLYPLVDQINQLENKVKQYKDEEFKKKTEEFKKSIIIDKVNPIKLLPLSFAMVRESAVRTLKMRHFDVQLMGGIVLYSGKIAEMKTGEGKTLTSTLPIYLRALEGRGVHVVTVNDYLAKRDSDWMAPIFHFLGLSVDCIDKHSPHSAERTEAYQADITYGTNNEFGFDYLRDNMVDDRKHRVQRSYYYCVIDEVDSVLIDEARTPLIISGPSESDTTKYYEIDKMIPRIREAKADEQGKEIPGTGDYLIDIKDRNVVITEDGGKKIETFLGVDSLYSQKNVEILHHVNQALRAHKLMQRDVDYIVEGGEVVIVDEFTGRKMEGRRFSDGLHQAIEAKERVNIASENQTLASITFQNYFRMYDLVSGMTGTADTEAEEFKKIYNLEVVVIPTNKSLIRLDHEDKIYRTEREKNNAIVERVYTAYKNGQPVLLGTISVDKSEDLSKALSRRGLKHEVLNAKNHSREAIIVEKAGQKGSITIATNMAGRGTDIKLGTGVKEAGGLLIIGSERSEARRVDNQLRGRSGRQGDQGESQFFLALDDELMKRFGSDRIANIMERLGMKEGEEIQHKWISNAIGNAQKKVEARNFDIRKHLLEYDDVMNSQRKYIYQERDYFLKHENLSEKIEEILEEIVADQLYSFASEREILGEQVFISLNKWMPGFFGLPNPYVDQTTFLKEKYSDVEEKLIQKVKSAYKNKTTVHPPTVVIAMERSVLLHILDSRWKEHLLRMDHLREGIMLRSYAEKKPLTEFKKEGFSMFEEMVSNFKFEVVETLFHVKIVAQAKQMERVMNVASESHETTSSLSGPTRTPSPTSNSKNVSKQLRSNKSIGRNDPCYCGSGKKFKRCHGKN